MRRHLPAPRGDDAVGHTYGPYRPAFERQQSTGNIFVVVTPLRCSRLSLYGHDFSGQVPQQINIVDKIDRDGPCTGFLSPRRSIKILVWLIEPAIRMDSAHISNLPIDNGLLSRPDQRIVSTMMSDHQWHIGLLRCLNKLKCSSGFYGDRFFDKNGTPMSNTREALFNMKRGRGRKNSSVRRLICKHFLEGLVTCDPVLNGVSTTFIAGVDHRDEINMAQRSDSVCVAASNKTNADNGYAKVLRHFVSFRRVRKIPKPMIAIEPLCPTWPRPYWGFRDSAIMYDIFIFTIHKFGLLVSLKNAN